MACPDDSSIRDQRYSGWPSVELPAPDSLAPDSHLQRCKRRRAHGPIVLHLAAFHRHQAPGDGFALLKIVGGKDQALAL